jgi:putative glycosyltransferase
MYGSRSFLEAFLAQSLEALREIEIEDFEIVLVNDGSPDDSLAYALSRTEDIAELTVIDLSRNFGHHNAMLAGLQNALGESVFLIDCDLEIPPSTLVMFYRKFRESGADVIYGYQESRKGGWFERKSGGLFWKSFNLLSETKIPENMVTERILSRRFVDALQTLGDHNLFLGGMMSWTGFTQIGVSVGKKQREGQSTYTLMKRVRLMINAVSSFSSQPLVWLFNGGVTITMLSFAYGGYLVVRKLIFGDSLLGFTSLMGFMALSLGILTTGLGLVGIYLGKVFNQVQNRPTYIIKDVHWKKSVR